MNSRAKQCVQTLADSIEEKDDGGWRYSGENSRVYDYLMPILIENLSINPEGLRVSKGRVRGDINELLLEVHDEDDPVSEFESRIGDVIEHISDLIVEKYTIAFPLNYDKRSIELLPDQLVFKNLKFEQVGFHGWKRDWVPDYEDAGGDRRLMELKIFLDKSPNDLTNSRYTYWKASCYARNEKFAIDHVSNGLLTVLGQLNFAMTYNRSQGRGIHSGPWPDRWSELRNPFIFLLYHEGEYQRHAFPSGDASYRKPESPHSAREDMFEWVLDWMPTFENEHAIDPRLIESFKMYQSGITNPHYEMGFFEFWRGIEILASIDDDLKSTNKNDAIAGIVERVAQIYDWENPDIAEIRLARVSEKRNEYVHEGEHDSINRNDYNLTKSLLEGVINFACDKRTEWDVKDWIFVLNNFETDNDILDQKQSNLKRRIELLEEMKGFGDD